MKDGGAQPGEVTQPYGNSYPRPARLLPILLASKYEKHDMVPLRKPFQSLALD